MIRAKDFQKLINEAIPDHFTLWTEVAKEWDFIIMDVYRDQGAQEKAFKAGNTKLHWPNGNHNKHPSWAVDALPYEPEEDIDWKDYERFCYFAGCVMTTAKRLLQEGKISHKLRWGRDWDSDTNLKEEKFLDYPHFEFY